MLDIVSPMKTFRTIFLLTVALFVKFPAQAADAVHSTSNSLELVLIDDCVVFTTVTNIPIAVIFRNVGETNFDARALLDGSSVVWDGKECIRDPNLSILYQGMQWLEPKSGWRTAIYLSRYLVPTDRLTPGRHTVALRYEQAESNTLTIFIGQREMTNSNVTQGSMRIQTPNGSSVISGGGGGGGSNGF